MKKNSGNIVYTHTDAAGLDAVAPLWQKLTAHHRARSVHFKPFYDTFTWAGRRQDLLEKAANGAMLVSLARDKTTGALVGYCVSTVNAKKQGEIESIFIESDYRRCGIGDRFMQKALAWMEAHHTARKVVGVAAGNEEAWGFYEKYGFYPRVTTLMEVKNEK